MHVLTRHQHHHAAMAGTMSLRPRRRARTDWKSLPFFLGIILAAFLVLFYDFVALDRPQSMTGGQAGADVISPQTHFGSCHAGGGINCVVDGDTFWMGGEKIRIADIDTPETHPALCAREAALGKAATKRLRSLLNAGPFSLQSIDRDTDRYGRKLRIVVRGGVSLGDVLVSEGLARPYQGGYREGWCR